MKNSKNKVIIIIRIITCVICFAIATYIIIPHHITEFQAIEYAKDYMNKNINDSRVEVYYEDMSYIYMSRDGQNIEDIYQKDTSIIKRIKNYWDPEFKYYYIGFKTNVSKPNSVYYLEVDSYTNHVQEGDPAIRWEYFKEQSNQIQ